MCFQNNVIISKNQKTKESDITMKEDTALKVFPLRIPAEMYDAVQELAKKNHRSMNAEIKEILHSEVPTPFMRGVDRTPLLRREGESKETWTQRVMLECIGCVNGEASTLGAWLEKQSEQIAVLTQLQKKYMEKDHEGVVEQLGKLRKHEDWINKVRNKQVMLSRYFTNEYMQHLEELLTVDDARKLDRSR